MQPLPGGKSSEFGVQGSFKVPGSFGVRSRCGDGGFLGRPQGFPRGWAFKYRMKPPTTASCRTRFAVAWIRSAAFSARLPPKTISRMTRSWVSGPS